MALLAESAAVVAFHSLIRGSRSNTVREGPTEEAAALIDGAGILDCGIQHVGDREMVAIKVAVESVPRAARILEIDGGAAVLPRHLPRSRSTS